VEKPMIEVSQLTKRFGDFTAVDGISFEVGQGEVLALLGPNGAGKTTTVRMLAAILKPTAGQAIIAGYNVVTQTREVQQRVGLLTEFPGLYLRMSGLEYLDFFGQLYNLPVERRRTQAEKLLRRFEMWEFRDQRLGEYSKGMRQKMALIRAMLHNPIALFLDEPTSAMDPHSARLVREAIIEARGEGRAVVLCTHNLAEAEALADHIAIIRRGQIIAQGSLVELKRQLLGDPVLELRLARPLNGLGAMLADLVQIESQGESWVRYRTPDPTAVNPVLLQRLALANVPVLTLNPVVRSLEDVYLRIVDEVGTA